MAKAPEERTHAEAVAAALAAPREYRVRLEPTGTGTVMIVVEDILQGTRKGATAPVAEATAMVASVIEDHLADSHDREHGILPTGYGVPGGSLERKSDDS